ncbi:MAG: chromate transporter [Clostridia bacterium]|nr:chromate transporter [Clostridia bacterium]
MIYLQLFFEFFKTGLFAIGGGLATIPFLNEIAVRTGWFTPEFLGDMIAVAESTPGPIGVNVATYAGFTTAGFFGALLATFGLVLPSYIIILIVGTMLEKFRKNPIVDKAFYGIRPAVVGMIASVALGLIGSALANVDFSSVKEFFLGIDWRCAVMFVAFLFATNKWKKLHPIVFIVIAGALGALLKL